MMIKLVLPDIKRKMPINNKNAIELIEMVESCFNNYHVSKLNHIWLSLQCCMNKIIEEKQVQTPSHEQRKIRKIEPTAYLNCCNTGSTQL
jgi:competence protein ComGC